MGWGVLLFLVDFLKPRSVVVSRIILPSILVNSFQVLVGLAGFFGFWVFLAKLGFWWGGGVGGCVLHLLGSGVVNLDNLVLHWTNKRFGTYATQLT